MVASLRPSMTRPSHAVAVALVAAVVLMPRPASGNSRPTTTTAQTTFKNGVEAVRLDVSVMRGGRPVRGSSAEDFVVTDNTVLQHIEGIVVDRLPSASFWCSTRAEA